MEPTFVHLNLHSEYSLSDSLIRIKPMVGAVADAGMAAVAITDISNLFALVKFYGAAQGAGIKPIAGCELWLENSEKPLQPYKILLLCKDREGYLNLSRLISKSYTDGQQRGVPIINRAWLSNYSRGLIMLSGGREGDIGEALLANSPDLAAELVTDYLRIFGDNFYLELQRTGRGGEEEYLHAAVRLAGAMDVPVVATNAVRFLKQGDFEAHEIRVCISEGRTIDDPRRPKRYSEQQYLRTPEEMVELFSDLPEAVENSVEIAKRCNLEMTLGEVFLPDFPIPDGLTEDEYFRKLSWEGLEQRLDVLLDRKAPDFSEKRKPYDERLEIELDVIIKMGFPGYFLIVADFIKWSKDNGIPVGPGRGSGAGSLVAYAMLITDLDPLEYDLLFERFLNPERVSMPDFDIDFCMDGRDRVIDYVARHYGRDKVSQIITYGSMAAKAVVRDVGRVMNHPYGFVDQIAKLIPFEVGITLEQAMEQEDDLRDLYERDEEVAALIDMARRLEGLTRNAGKHAGGVVISPTALTDFTPLYCDEGGGNVVSQFDKNDVEAVGLVKFDFLGLRTLTIIDWALKHVENVLGKKIDIAMIPLDDPATFKLLMDSQTTAVFQLESRGMKELISRLLPNCFEDIVALVALFRPGPLQSGMVDDFINRKHGRAKVEYPHPDLEPILQPTYGVILYQEQVMQIAQVLAGYTLGGADMLRRAMGKKKPEEMAKQRDIFTKGALENGVEEKTATYIFDLMEKFAGYGFNKSHSAAYALVSYQTAWLKAHYPSAFMAAVLSADMDNTDKVVMLIDECSSMKLKVLSPSINHSDYKFTVLPSGEVVYGLGAIKGVGEGAIEGIVEERKKSPFTDLYEFCRRVDLKKTNKRVLESLIRAGALDGLNATRASMMAVLPNAIKLADQDAKNQAAGIDDLFGFEGESLAQSATEIPELPEWDDDTRLGGEKETLGLYLTGHPIDRYLEELGQFISTRIAGIKPEKGRNIIISGLIIAIRTMNTKRGDKIAFITLDDKSARVEIALFTEAYAQFGAILAKDRLVVVEGEASIDDYSGANRMQASFVTDIDGARERYAKKLQLKLKEQSGAEQLAKLRSTIEPYCEGITPIHIEYQNRGATAQLILGDEWYIRPAEQLIQRLRHILGDENVQLDYGKS